MNVRIKGDLESRLTRLAAERGLNTEALVDEAIRKFMDHDDWFAHEVESGLAAADRGELIEHEDIKKLIDRRYPS